MGMAVKGVTEHRVIRAALSSWLKTVMLPQEEQEACVRLERRADLAIERIKKRRKRRAVVHEGHLAGVPERTGDQPV